MAKYTGIYSLNSFHYKCEYKGMEWCTCLKTTIVVFKDRWCNRGTRGIVSVLYLERAGGKVVRGRRSQYWYVANFINLNSFESLNEIKNFSSGFQSTCLAFLSCFHLVGGTFQFLLCKREVVRSQTLFYTAQIWCKVKLLVAPFAFCRFTALVLMRLPLLSSFI